MKRFLILGLLAFPLLADQQQPFDTTSVGLHVGYDSDSSKHAVPSVDITRKMGNPIAGFMGFQPFAYEAFEVTGVKSHPLQLQVKALTGMALAKQLGEYVYYGFLGAGGVVADGTSMGAGGKFGGFLGYRFGHAQHWSVEAVVSGDVSTLEKLAPTAFIGVRYGWGRSAPAIRGK